jgi:hypothetical protein
MKQSFFHPYFLELKQSMAPPPFSATASLHVKQVKWWRCRSLKGTTSTVASHTWTRIWQCRGVCVVGWCRVGLAGWDLGGANLGASMGY